MEKDSRIGEPAVDRWQSASPTHELTEETAEGAGLAIFNLSAGIMRERARTSNRIDGLLTKMMEHSTTVKYLADIDKNLDYLFTSLQLDMINTVAKEVSARDQRKVPLAERPRSRQALPDEEFVEIEAF